MAAVDQVLKEQEKSRAEAEAKAAKEAEALKIPPMGDVEELEKRFGKEGSEMLATLTAQVGHLKREKEKLQAEIQEK